MHQIVESIRSTATEFVDQRENFALLVACSDTDWLLLLKTVEELDESRDSELYWMAVDAFDDARSYVQACVAMFEAKHEAVRANQASRGETPLPPMTTSLLDSSLNPVERLKELLRYSRDLLPSLDGFAVVWALAPSEIHDRDAYRAFIEALCEHEFPFPWCHHMRLFIRDAYPERIFDPNQFELARVSYCHIDASNAAVEAALRESADDDDAPIDQRINSALMLAGIDYSHGRYEDARQGYEVVHHYALTVGEPTYGAIALNGLGEVHRATGDGPAAMDMFRAALGPAAQAPNPPIPVLINVYESLGKMHHAEEEWEEAEVFLHGAAEFALVMRDATKRLRMWELLGEAQLGQDKHEDAASTWYSAAVVAGRLEKQSDYDMFLERLRDLYEPEDPQFDTKVLEITDLVEEHLQEEQARREDAQAQMARAGATA
ncbi:MAG: hypothetical protein AAF662_09375 [Pseudomonadota bacterium]